jgi:CRISPR-associated RAMP protein (TIGR02581 family)
MLKALVNEARLSLNITTRGPLLVKTGEATVIGTQMAPIQTYRNGRKEVFLPGSSLKGLFRSHSEKVINGIKARVACNPLLWEDHDARDEGELYRPACGSRFAKEMPPHKVYADSCPTCRLFGSTSFGSRIAIEDAYLTRESANREFLLEHRDEIAIDRLTGGVSGNAKFDLTVVTEGTTFSTDIHLRNFEIWQLGLLFVIIQDMEDELLRLGSGRSRGLGKIKASISDGSVTLSSARRGKDEEPDNQLWGLGRWLDKEAAAYRTEHNDLLTLSPPVAHVASGIRRTRIFKEDALDKLRAGCIDAFFQRIQTWESAHDLAAAAPQRSQQ